MPVDENECDKIHHSKYQQQDESTDKTAGPNSIASDVCIRLRLTISKMPHMSYLIELLVVAPAGTLLFKIMIVDTAPSASSKGPFAAA